MKKLLLFTCLSALALTFNSCSDDDSAATTGGDTFKVTVNGAEKTFKNVTVVKEEYDTNLYYIHVTATNADDTSQILEFDADVNELGNEGYSWEYLDYGTQYYEGNTGGVNYLVNSNIEINDGSRIKGTFSGALKNQQNNTILNLNEGSFDINY